ncbi:hypothetical protein B0T24DRAFT_245629 [Lasiosphaeria ovina]|uniref:Uncharacterized protein n=1 Tax=Lasiosphaeria ovina TaxID=92902 RepID=A0AAE0KB36_9PEZI|nr:hypothetical protein B0T24DRAFT_245629 [Lasiosphaeria ovina]
MAADVVAHCFLLLHFFACLAWLECVLVICVSQIAATDTRTPPVEQAWSGASLASCAASQYCRLAGREANELGDGPRACPRGRLWARTASCMSLMCNPEWMLLHWANGDRRWPLVAAVDRRRLAFGLDMHAIHLHIYELENPLTPSSLVGWAPWGGWWWEVDGGWLWWVVGACTATRRRGLFAAFCMPLLSERDRLGKMAILFLMGFVSAMRILLHLSAHASQPEASRRPTQVRRGRPPLARSWKAPSWCAWVCVCVCVLRKERGWPQVPRYGGRPMTAPWANPRGRSFGSPKAKHPPPASNLAINRECFRRQERAPSHQQIPTPTTTTPRPSIMDVTSVSDIFPRQTD